MSLCSWLQEGRIAGQLSPTAAAASCPLANRAWADLENQPGEGKAGPCAEKGVFGCRLGESSPLMLVEQVCCL